MLSPHVECEKSAMGSIKQATLDAEIAFVWNVLCAYLPQRVLLCLHVHGGPSDYYAWHRGWCSDSRAAFLCSKQGKGKEERHSRSDLHKRETGRGQTRKRVKSVWIHRNWSMERERELEKSWSEEPAPSNSNVKVICCLVNFALLFFS